MVVKEPSCAAIGYLYDLLRIEPEDKIVAYTGVMIVWDFGGGTFDSAVLIIDEKMKITVVNTRGVRRVELAMKKIIMLLCPHLRESTRVKTEIYTRKPHARRG